MKKSLLLFSVFVITLIGCKNDDGLNQTFTAFIQADQLVLSNMSNEDIFYFAVDQNTLAVINWAPGVGNDQPLVQGNETLSLPLSEVIGFSDETETIILHHWKAVMIDGQLQPGEIQIIELNL